MAGCSAAAIAGAPGGAAAGRAAGAARSAAPGISRSPGIGGSAAGRGAACRVVIVDDTAGGRARTIHVGVHVGIGGALVLIGAVPPGEGLAIRTAVPPARQ